MDLFDLEKILIDFALSEGVSLDRAQEFARLYIEFEFGHLRLEHEWLERTTPEYTKPVSEHIGNLRRLFSESDTTREEQGAQAVGIQSDRSIQPPKPTSAEETDH